MKLLKEGFTEKPWSARLTCHWCGAELEIGESDLVESTYPSPGPHYEYRCVGCNRTQEVRLGLPHVVSHRIK